MMRYPPNMISLSVFFFKVHAPRTFLLLCTTPLKEHSDYVPPMQLNRWMQEELKYTY